MEKIYIISENNFKFSDKFVNFVYIDYPRNENFIEDNHFHDFVLKIFKEYNPTNLVIPLKIGADNFVGLTIGMHIRLNSELTIIQKLIPILFLSDKHNYESIFSDNTLEIKLSRNYQHYLLLTPNIFLEKINPDFFSKIFSLAEVLTISDYKNKFLDAIKILPSDFIGSKHSIANIWGVFQLSKVTKLQEELDNNEKLKKLKKDLYFKFIEAISIMPTYNLLEQKTENNLNYETKILISSENKKILFIDDEADKGWQQILEKIFKNSKFDTFEFEKINDNEQFISKNIEKLKNNLKNDYDLILLDLRLIPDEDMQQNKTAKDFSGMQFLKEIKKINKGYQVIVFTASNKAWNMKELLDEGADGYYIKESPEFAFDLEYSEKNYESFRKNVEI